MKILERLKKKRTSMPRNRVALSQDSEDAPKNGRLTLAVIASILVTVFLGALNVKLMNGPSEPAGEFDRPARARSGPDDTRASCSVTPVPQPAPSKKDPPPMSFYKTLTAQDEQPPAAGGSESGTEPGSHPATPPGSADSAAKPGSKETRATPQAQGTPPPPRLPAKNAGVKRYTVQVGTFSRPSVAKQWAAKWKARGFTVILRPVARPKTGVTYRLYLGSFRSRKKADEMVKRLKKKEGITAFRTALR
jgi:cell division septation protein DedD